MKLKTDIPEMCNDSPRRKLIVELNVGFAEGNAAKVMPFLSDAIVWEMANDKILYGFEEVSDFLEQIEKYKADRLVIRSMITHGKMAACNGLLKYGDEEVHFADFYEFTSAGSATIKKITSYIPSKLF